MSARNFFTCLHSTFSFVIITHLCMLVTEKSVFPIAVHTHLERDHAFFFLLIVLCPVANTVLGTKQMLN